MKSSFSGDLHCIEVMFTGNGEIHIMETQPVFGVVQTSRENFAAFIKGVKAGEFDHFVEGVD